MAAPVQLEGTPLTVFLAGAVAICAMILPGISGSFILVLLGLYSLVLGAVKNLQLDILLLFASGCVLGLLSFARVLSWLLQHWRDMTLAFLTGLMVGSLNKVWPWKQTLSWRTDSSGVSQPVLQENLWPTQFALQFDTDPQLLAALLLAAGGITLVLGLEWLAKRLSLSGERD